MIRLAIAEDNNFLAKAIEEKCALFDDLNHKFRTANGKLLVDQLNKNSNVDVILMDIQMPVMDGIEAAEIVKYKFPHIKIIMLTVFDDEENIFKAIQAGADGYLLKDENAKSIYAAIHEIIDGGAPMSPSIALKTLKILRNPPIFEKSNVDYELTKREVEVLEQLSKGLNYQEISENLNISKGTVRKHIENTYRKLQVHNKMEAVALAKKERII